MNMMYNVFFFLFGGGLEFSHVCAMDTRSRHGAKNFDRGLSHGGLTKLGEV